MSRHSYRNRVASLGFRAARRRSLVASSNLSTVRSSIRSIPRTRHNTLEIEHRVAITGCRDIDSRIIAGRECRRRRQKKCRQQECNRLSSVHGTNSPSKALVELDVTEVQSPCLSHRGSVHSPQMPEATGFRITDDWNPPAYVRSNGRQQRDQIDRLVRDEGVRLVLAPLFDPFGISGRSRRSRRS